MTRPSPLVLLILLLGTTWLVAPQPLVRVMALLGILAVICAIVVAMLIRRGWRMPLLAFVGIVGLAAFVGVGAIRPQLRQTYLPDQLTHASEVADSRGFYPSETDGAGNRFSWTQDRATLILDFLVRKPITLTVEMRSAAVASGPDEPVDVVVNGVEVGQLHPDPTNANFQPLSLRFVPFNWGGEQTEIKLLPATFRPGKGDTRSLGVMVKSITIDKTEAWSSVSRWRWLLWILPLFALIAAGLLWASRRNTRPALIYGAIALAVLGSASAALFVLLIQRVNVIDITVYRVWSLSTLYLCIAFALAAINIPLGSWDAPTAWQWARRRLRARKRRDATAPPRERMSRADIRRAIVSDLALVFLLALSVRAVWVLIDPPWLGPDEPDHYTYVSHVAEEARVPHPPDPLYPYYPAEQLHSGGITLAGGLSTGISGSITRQLPYYPLDYDYATAREYTAPTQDRLSSAGARATGYPGLYYILAAGPYKLLQHAPIVSRLFAARMTSALFGAISCIFGYLLAYEVRRERRWGWALGMCMALLPMYVFDTAIANNDSLMDMFATALIWLVVRAWLKREVHPWLAFAVGAAGGLMLFAKPTGIILVPASGVILLVKAWPGMRITWQRLWERALSLGAYVGGLLAGYGPWLIFRLRFYHDFGIGTISFTPLFRLITGTLHVSAAPIAAPGGDPTGAPTLFATAATHSIMEYLRYEQKQGWPYFHWLLIKTFWGYFGFLDTPMSDGAYRAITIFCVIGLIGLTLQLVLQSRRRVILVLLIGIVLVQSLTLFLLPDYYVNFRVTGTPVGIQGRYFFPVIAPILFLYLSGWDLLLGEHRAALRLAPLLMLIVQGIGLATMLAAYYGVAIG